MDILVTYRTEDNSMRFTLPMKNIDEALKHRVYEVEEDKYETVGLDKDNSFGYAVVLIKKVVD